ncbi:MAG: efflux transporter periplasmic adaptor subunit, partial [Pseudomonadota bacterium]
MTPAAKRLTFWAIPVLALALVLAWLFRPVAVPVDTAAVERGPLTVSVIDEGQTRVHDVYVVSAPVPGRMRRIDNEVGDAVIADETVVARIEPSDPSFLDVRSAAEARAALAAAAAARTLAEAEVSRAQAERDFARADHERLRALAPSRSISASDLDASQRRARTADAALAAAQAARRVRESEYQVARARLMPPSSRRGAVPDCDCVSVRSPVSGQVLR